MTLKIKRAPSTGFTTREFAATIKADSDKAKGSFSGYGSVFGNVDSYGEIVAPGAFVRSLAEKAAAGRKIPILYQHDRGEPMGVFGVCEEDPHGLRVEGALLVDDVPRARSSWANMQVGALTGLSIGYYVRAYEVRDDQLVLTDLDLQEISIVTFPANDAARIDAVKATIARGEIPSRSQFERFLRDAGFSRTQAAVIVNRGLSHLLTGGEPGADYGDAIKAAQAFRLPSF